MGGGAAAKGRSTDERLAREIEHGRKIAGNAESVWFWESPAGRRRAQRRAELFIEHGGLGPGRRALELGCGTGVFLERVAKSGAQIHGLDVSEDLLEKARARVAAYPNVVVERGNAEASPYPAGHFDAVYGSSILHHLELDAALAEAHRVLRPGGRVVFAEPNILNPQVLLMFLFPPLKERFGVTPDEMAFSRFRARRALERAGFADVAVEPFDFLHPSIPESWVERGLAASRALERLPLVREIAGSMLMRARRA